MTQSMLSLLLALLTLGAVATDKTTPADAQWSKEGFQGAFQVENGKFFYDSAKANANEKYRWARVSDPRNLAGDFRARLAYTIAFLHHYNGFELEVRSLEKDAFLVTLRREQKAQGKHQLLATVSGKGRQTVRKEIPYGAFIGALIVRREKGKLILEAENSKGAVSPVLEIADFPAAPAKAAVKFSSPARTQSKVEIREFSAESKTQLSHAQYPVFAPVRKISTAELLDSKRAKVLPDGTISIEHGGRAVLVLNMPSHLKNIRLHLPAEGALKVTAVPVGRNEPTVVGEAILWDETAQPEGLRERIIAPGGFLTRHPFARKWDYPLLTENTPLFLTIEPAGKEKVRIGAMTLHAAAMLPGEPQIFPPSNASFDRSGLLVPPAKGESIALSGKPLPLRSGDQLDGKFVVAPHLLSAKRDGFTFPVGRQIDAVEVVHTAGRQLAGETPIPAAYQFLYDDNSTATEFVTLRWNTGIYHSDFLPRGSADYTWWGPVGFPRCELIAFPRGAYGQSYDGAYRTMLVNPHPERKVKNLSLYRMPGNTSEFLLLSMRLLERGTLTLGAVEPKDTQWTANTRVPVQFFLWSPGGRELPEGLRPAMLCRGKTKIPAGEVSFVRKGQYSYGQFDCPVPANRTLPPGPAQLVAAGVSSPLLGVMPEGKQNFHYSMICGPNEARADFERMRRIGFDTVKLVIPWSEEKPGMVRFPGHETYLERITSNQLQFSIRNHIRFKRGPEYFAKQAVFQQRYAPGKPVEERPQIDPADPWTVERIVNLYRETARFARAKNAVSINVNYGLRPETGLGRIDMGAASLAMFRKRLGKNFSLAEINRNTKRHYASFEEIVPLDLYTDASGFLLREYLRMHHENLASAQRKVMQAIREEGYQGHLVSNVSFHPIEQKLIGANTGAYLRLSKEFPPAALYHETSDRYSLSFVKFLSSKRTLNLPYGDEGCLTPPPDLQNRMAYLWMGTMQCFDALCCQWFGGKPGMLNVAAIKPFHAMLYEAEYLPDDFQLALALDSGFAEAPETVRSRLHGRTGSHYGLINTLRELNLNADRYWIDEFPELDKNARHRLMIDDISRAISPAFGARIEKFVRDGGVFLASSETDRCNHHAFLKRFGIDPAKSAPGAIVRKTAGKGMVILRNARWETGSWDPGLAEAKRRNISTLITEAGKFLPNVKSDKANVAVTPYRAKNGDLLIQAVNLAAAPARVRISWKKTMVKGSRAYDHATGTFVEGTDDGRYRSADFEIMPMNATVISVKENAEK
ncbi:MAG: hypothetical protein PHS41_03465 [Victivallaceae bacterium]|nr:hypothetical protein [Victivallaceae bacterium]